MDIIFKNHPDLPEYFQTSDGEKFYKKDLAKNHVRTFALKDAKITIVLRPDESETTLAEKIAFINQMDQDAVTYGLEAEHGLDEPSEQILEALTNRNAQLQAINSAKGSAAEFENSHATVNTIVDEAVIGKVEAGAPYKVVDTADGAQVDANRIVTNVEHGETLDRSAAEINTVDGPVETAHFADGSAPDVAKWNEPAVLTNTDTFPGENSIDTNGAAVEKKVAAPRSTRTKSTK